MAKQKLLASISLDLDDQWSYMKVHGDDGWEEFPSYLDIVIPIFLDVLDRLDIKITFLVFVEDASLRSIKRVIETTVLKNVGLHYFEPLCFLNLCFSFSFPGRLK